MPSGYKGDGIGCPPGIASNYEEVRRKGSLSTLHCLDCFTRAAGKKVTPSGLNRHLSTWRKVKFANREGLVSTSSLHDL